MPWRQKSSLRALGHLDPRGSRQNGRRSGRTARVPEDTGADAVERLDRRALGVGSVLSMRGGTAPTVRPSRPADAVLRGVPDDLSAAGGVADHDNVLQVERVDELGEVAGVGVHVVAL